MYQSLRFGDLPIGTKFHHPKTNEIYQRVEDVKLLAYITKKSKGTAYNAVSVDRKVGNVDTLIHPDTIVTLTESIDFFSLNYSTKFAYERKVYTKIARNRAKHGDITKHFEPSDSVSPL